MRYGDYCIYTDEVGYGAWSGPVVVCSILHEKTENASVKDSKLLTKKMRYNIAGKIKKEYTFALSWSHSWEIDKIGLRAATDNAMINSWNLLERKYHMFSSNCCHKRATLFNLADSLYINPMNILLDGKYIPQTKHNVENLIYGDQNNLIISYASIIAKETRDAYMRQLHKIYPEYCWESNVGYGTKNHIDAISKFGVTKFHRQTYKPLKQFANDAFLYNDAL